MADEGLSEFNPGAIQSVYVNADDNDDYLEEEKEIEAGIAKELAELSDFSDGDDESVIEQENQEFPIYQESTPYNSHRLPHENGQTVPSNEDAILHGSDGARNLEILYNARGVEIDRLRSANEEEKNKYIAEIHKLRHENTLLKGHLERNQIKMEDCEQTSQNLSDANHALRKELDELKKNLLKNEKENNDLKSMNENSTMTIKQLHSNYMHCKKVILYSEPSTSMKKLQDHLKKDMKTKFTNFKMKLTA